MRRPSSSLPAVRFAASPIQKYLLILACLVLVVFGCRTWTPVPSLPQATVVAPHSIEKTLPAATQQSLLPVDQPALSPTLAAPLPEPFAPEGSPVTAPAGEPAGCLASNTQATLDSVETMLGYADGLLGLSRPLASRRLDTAWNVTTRSILSARSGEVLNFDVRDVQNLHMLQKMMNALHVAGFVTWLRAGPDDGLHIIAIPLRDPALMQSDWSLYLSAYWHNREMLPPGDPFVIPALKLPPCAWMVSAGFAPQLGPEWWPEAGAQTPDLAAAANAYIALTTADANRVARQIDWLGWNGLEAPGTMCGPLTWAILDGSDSFPVGLGAWSRGPESFWLADPRGDGRPWSLFPKDTYHLYHYSQAVGAFDFATWPLYPGDVLYLYSKGDGFDHMLVVTEVDAAGNVYTVTNLIQVYPVNQMTIEREVLYNPNDPAVGLFKNEWRLDRKNGRTGHDGFDVLRWAWREKDLQQQPVAYIAEPGDTFDLISLRWKTPAGLIARYNGLEVGNSLTVGQLLLIPPD